MRGLFEKRLNKSAPTSLFDNKENIVFKDGIGV